MTTYRKPEHPGRGVLWFALASFVAMVLVISLFGPQRDTSGRRPEPRPAVVYDHSILERDANTTLGLSNPGANTTAGATSLPPTVRQQLQHSTDPEFIGELEEHEREIDRMLARETP